MRICDSVKSITDLSLNPFRIVVVREDERLARYIVDGQHRVSILKKYFTDPEAVDFDVVIIEKHSGTTNKTRRSHSSYPRIWTPQIATYLNALSENNKVVGLRE
jgi:hypothetical protein